MNAEDKEPRNRASEALAKSVSASDGPIAFGDMTAAVCRAQGERLSDVGTFGPLQRVVKVAQAWKLLAAQMERDGAATVRELPAEAVVESAERLWIIPPPEGMVEQIRG